MLYTSSSAISKLSIANFLKASIITKRFLKNAKLVLAEEYSNVIHCCPTSHFDNIFLMGTPEICFKVRSRFPFYCFCFASVIQGCEILTPSQKRGDIILNPLGNFALGFDLCFAKVQEKKFEMWCRYFLTWFEVKSIIFFASTVC